MHLTNPLSLSAALLATLLATATATAHCYSDDDGFNLDTLYARGANPDTDFDYLDLLEARDAELNNELLEARDKTYYFTSGSTKKCRRCGSICSWNGKGSVNIPGVGKGDHYWCSKCQKDCGKK